MTQNNTNDLSSAPLHRVVGRIFNCPICLMQMSDYDGGCIRHDVDEINQYIDRLRISWADIKRTVDTCDSGVGLFVKNRMNDWESHMFQDRCPPRDIKHDIIIKSDGEGNMSTFFAACSCGWSGLKYHTHSDYAYTDAIKSGKNHVKECSPPNTAIPGKPPLP